MDATTSESSEERFRAVFGSHRSSSWHPSEMRALKTSDFDDCHAVELANEQITLYCRPQSLEPWEPFLWVTRGGDPDPTYISSADAWGHDTTHQLRLLAQALCREQLMNSRGAPEWDAKSRREREYLRISETQVRIITLLPYKLIASWSREELSESPATICLALVQALQDS